MGDSILLNTSQQHDFSIMLEYSQKSSNSIHVILHFHCINIQAIQSNSMSHSIFLCYKNFFFILRFLTLFNLLDT